MKRQISRHDLEDEVRSNLESAGAPQPASLGDVLSRLPDRAGAAPHRLFRGYFRFAALGVAAALAISAVGMPFLMSRPNPAASPTAEPSQIADLTPEPTDLPTVGPMPTDEVPTDTPTDNPTNLPTETPTPTATPTAAPTARRTPKPTPTPVPAPTPAHGQMTEPRASHIATRLTDGRVLIIEGNGSNTVSTAELYDPRTDNFTPLGDMPIVAEGSDATLLADGRVLITGGSDPTINVQEYLNSAQVFDPATGKFTATGSMHATRRSQAANKAPKKRWPNLKQSIMR